MSEIKQIRYKERFAILYEAKKRPFVHAVLCYNYNPGGQNKLKPHHHVLAVDFRGDVSRQYLFHIIEAQHRCGEDKYILLSANKSHQK